VCFPLCPLFLAEGFKQQQATAAYLIGAGILTDRHFVARIPDVNGDRKPVRYRLESRSPAELGRQARPGA
jgi:hypothetical protein